MSHPTDTSSDHAGGVVDLWGEPAPATPCRPRTARPRTPEPATGQARFATEGEQLAGQTTVITSGLLPAIAAAPVIVGPLEPIRCDGGCGRMLTAPASIRRGRGPRCDAKVRARQRRKGDHRPPPTVYPDSPAAASLRMGRHVVDAIPTL